jgi:hypothetical protein
VKWTKKLFCKHEYKYKYQHMRDCGMGKVIIYECDKCKKRKVNLI